MTASYALLAAVAALAISACATASANPDGLYSLDGSGYAIVRDGVSPASFGLTVIASSSTGDEARLTVTSGTLVYDADEFDTPNIDAEFLRDSKFIRLSGIIERSGGDHVTISLLGRLAENVDDESLYIITGTLGNGAHEGRAAFAAQLLHPSQAAAKEPEDNPLRVSLLPEPGNEGAPPGHLDRVSVQALVGQSVTITNKDTIPHRLVSGGLHEWVYERDGPPRVCDSEGMRDDVIEKEARIGTHLSGGDSFSFTIPEERDSKAPTANKPTPGCDFTRDGITDITIEPGASASVNVGNLGFYRLLDVTSPWIQLEIVSLKEIRGDQN